MISELPSAVISVLLLATSSLAEFNNESALRLLVIAVERFAARLESTVVRIEISVAKFDINKLSAAVRLAVSVESEEVRVEDSSDNFDVN